jgi:aldehyde:ferredoxin oxidoreductase
VNEFGWVCGWVMECMEKGYLTEKQVGFRLTWGDVEGSYKLLQMISHRQGFGDILAEGVKRASEKIGGKAAACAIYTMKGASPRGHDHRGRWEEMLDTCTSSNGTMESANPTFQTEIGLPGRINPFNGEEVARMVGGILGRALRGFPRRLHYLPHPTEPSPARFAATGWTYTPADALGRRTAAILRANLRCGIGTDLEYLSARYGCSPWTGRPRITTSWTSGAHARGVVRDGGLRHQDGKAHARELRSWPRPRAKDLWRK